MSQPSSSSCLGAGQHEPKARKTLASLKMCQMTEVLSAGGDAETGCRSVAQLHLPLVLLKALAPWWLEHTHLLDFTVLQ